MPTGKTKKHRKHTRTGTRRKTKRKKERTRKRKKMKSENKSSMKSENKSSMKSENTSPNESENTSPNESENTSPIKNIFYSWLGETTKCGLTSDNLKSWREGFPEAKITILVMKEKISEFNAHFDFLSKYSVELRSPVDFLDSFLHNEPVKKTVALLEKYLPFLMDGEKSL